MLGKPDNKLLNSISNNKDFQDSCLGETFRQKPLGFVDVGSSGGIHPLILPVASLTHCTCFEPDKASYDALVNKYSEGNLFAGMTILKTAVAESKGTRDLFVTKSQVNSSLLEPNDELVSRYKVSGFQVEKKIPLETKSLDSLLAGGNEGDRLGEFVKLDCQGVEYEILQGATNILEGHCMSLWCELEFFPMYRNQRTFAEVDLFLRGKGFVLYGLYPNYVSAKKLNRREFETEERIVWADALYFKDPLAALNRDRTFGKREIHVLLISAILARYYDFALDILGSCGFNKEDQGRLGELIQFLAKRDRDNIERDLHTLIDKVGRRTGDSYLLAKKFIDRHGSNNNIDFINLQD
jgi:FkbM family methyltransferase